VVAGVRSPFSGWLSAGGHCWYLEATYGLLSSADGKASTCNAGDLGLIPGLGRSLGEGNGNPLQYSFLGNSMDR